MALIEVRLYSILRKITNKQNIIIELEEPYVKTLLVKLTDMFPDLKKFIEKTGISLLVIDNDGHRLSLKDKIRTTIVHVMPPPSGGTPIKVYLAHDEDSNQIISDVLNFLNQNIEEDTGATLVFIGTVRKLNKGEIVEYLKYEDAGEITLKIFEEIASDVQRKPGVRRVIGVHYVGTRKPGDVTLVLGVSGISRKDVFPALIEFIERVKSELPIWKTEQTTRGERYILGGDNIVLDEDS